MTKTKRNQKGEVDESFEIKIPVVETHIPLVSILMLVTSSPKLVLSSNKKIIENLS